MSLLFECLQVDVLHGLGGRIAGCWAEALCSGYGGEGGNMTIALCRELAIDLTDHSCETDSIGLKRG